VYLPRHQKRTKKEGEEKKIYAVVVRKSRTDIGPRQEKKKKKDFPEQDVLLVHIRHTLPSGEISTEESKRGAVARNTRGE